MVIPFDPFNGGIHFAAIADKVQVRIGNALCSSLVRYQIKRYFWFSVGHFKLGNNFR